jgi:hypothetical protein
MPKVEADLDGNVIVRGNLSVGGNFSKALLYHIQEPTFSTDIGTDTSELVFTYPYSNTPLVNRTFFVALI